MSANPNELLTPAEAAKKLKVSERCLTEWRYRRHGPPFVKAMKAVRYRAGDLDAWIKAQTVRTK